MVESLLLANLNVPFRDSITRDKHFDKHRHKFGIVIPDAFAYERMADEFMDGVMNAATKQCSRVGSGDRLRFDHVTFQLGIACVNPVFVRTFYPVDAVNVQASGGPDKYFSYKCREPHQ
jgi:hypothetical protein